MRLTPGSVLTLDRLRLAMNRNQAIARKTRPEQEPWPKVLESNLRRDDEPLEPVPAG